MRRTLLALTAGTTTAGAVAAGYVGLVTGRLTIDLGVGRRIRDLGPIAIDVWAPRQVVYDMAAAPYADRRPQALQEKVQILERADGMVLAAHRTPLPGGLTAVTVEAVTLDPPHRIGFRLVRGPVPHVSESFTFEVTRDGTRLRYDGELGTDLGRLGQSWGDLVARTWIGTVQRSLDDIRSASENRRPPTESG